ncbi:MAG: ribonucleoside-diphosphate reductase subunit alpha [Myxococcota bacterium]
MLQLTNVNEQSDNNLTEKASALLPLDGVAQAPPDTLPVHLRSSYNLLAIHGIGLQININEIIEKVAHSSYADIAQHELDDLLIRTAASLIVEEPDYTFLAARLLSHKMEQEAQSQNVTCFSHSVTTGYENGLISKRTYDFVCQHAQQLDAMIDSTFNQRLTFFGLRTLCDRYVLRHPKSRKLLETAQYMFLRVACGVADDVAEAQQLYRLFASLDYLPSSPTLFNSGTTVAQMSSCFLLDSPQDSLESIYDRYKEIALLSKYSGGIGVAYHRVRSSGSRIKGTNGLSNGLAPWIKTLDSSVYAVNQGGRRKGACCVYLEPWHADIETFLELRDNTGDDARRTYNLNLANWIPDLFMKRVESDQPWSLFDPTTVPHLCDLYGQEFDKAYVEAEQQGLALRTVRARDLYRRMMRTLAQTGNGWMTFKDACNAKSNQTGVAGNVIHLSNLCTEILEVTSHKETAVCNLGSINLGRHVTNGKFDFAKLGNTVRLAVQQLNKVVDLTYYPIEQAKQSNSRWRPVGLGVMGLQDLFFQLNMPFDAPEAKQLSAQIAEEIYYHALSTSADLAQQQGPHETFAQTKAAQAILQFDLWGFTPSDTQRWQALKQRIQQVGLRNSLLIAIAPTATIASIAGCYECIEPQLSNIFKRETLSGEFLQINMYLVQKLKELGLWTQEIRDQIVQHEGSIQAISAIPKQLRQLFRTVWEYSMKSLIDMAAARGPFVDQSQSLNLFMENPDIAKMSSMYFYVWQQAKLKTTYYLRSRPATSIRKATVGKKAQTPQEKRQACSLENPQTCEACQ